jgi:hypothetical protein
MSFAPETDAALQSSDQIDAARFLRTLFEAIARRDWPTVAISVHAEASLVTVDLETDEIAVLPWDEVAPAFHEWVERSVTAPKFAFLPEKLALEVVGQQVNVTSRFGGPRLMVLAFEGGRWQVNHMHLSRLGIPLTASDIEFSFRGVPLPHPRRLQLGE